MQNRKHQADQLEEYRSKRAFGVASISLPAADVRSEGWPDGSIGTAGKHRALVVRKERPLNAGPPLEIQRRSFITPIESFFVRNHGTIPIVSPQTYFLSVTGLVRKHTLLSLEDLFEHYPRVSVTATVQCAGNRRREMSEARKIQGEIPWDTEAVSTAVWSGVRLRHVLSRAGLEADAAHVAFTGLDVVQTDSEITSFGGSIPIEKAMAFETILAYEMNGKRLPPLHGYPLRVVVPGYIGARSVKWLREISVRAEPSDNHFQRNAYKLFPPSVDAETAKVIRGQMLGEQRINSVICQPLNGDIVADDVVSIEGYATGSSGESVEHVELSVNGGKSWLPATLVDSAFAERDRPWVWRFWKADLRLSAGRHQIIVRAWDSASSTQPANVSSIWNYKGYLNNAWHRVNITVEEPD